MMWCADPLRIVMLGDLVDLGSFAEEQSDRLGITVSRINVQHLAHRREMNGFPGPLLRFVAGDIYERSIISVWWDGYILTHPKFLGGKALPALREAMEKERRQ